MKLKPLGDRIIVRREASEEKTAGGIVLPDTAKNKPQRGKVLAVGPGKLLKDGSRRSLQVKEGDTVLFTTWAGDEFKEQRSKDEILVMREEDILAVLGEEEDPAISELLRRLKLAFIPKDSACYDRRTQLLGK